MKKLKIIWFYLRDTILVCCAVASASTLAVLLFYILKDHL